MRTTRFWSSTQRKMRRSEVIKSATYPFPSPVCQIMRWVGKTNLAGNHNDYPETTSWFITDVSDHDVGLKTAHFRSQASIRAPVGATFVPRTAHLKMIKPRIKTRAGEVIEPMSRYQIQDINSYGDENENINSRISRILLAEHLLKMEISKPDWYLLNFNIITKQGTAGAAWHCERGLEDCQVAVIFFSLQNCIKRVKIYQKWEFDFKWDIWDCWAKILNLLSICNDHSFFLPFSDLD